jgi:PEP-CTERM motif
MKKSILAATTAAMMAFGAPQAASAATIVNINTAAGTLLFVDLTTASGAALNLRNASSPYQNNNQTAYIINEGVFSGVQNFLLHFDDKPANPQGRVTGSFDILLAAGETVGSLFTATSTLISSDPASGALYSLNGNRGLENNGNGIDSIALSLLGQTATVRFDLRANQAVDNARITIIEPVVAAVPEPATWLTMLLGFGVIGFAARRQKKAGVATA